MAQDIFSSIDPSISGTELAETLTDFKDAIVSGMSGTSRPTELNAGGMWVDTTNDPTSWTLKLWTGTSDITIFTIDITNSAASVSLAVDSFSVTKVSADAVGAILELVKRRVASNGQVTSSTVCGEIRVVGRTATGTDPVVAKFIWTAGENQTTSAFGGTFSLYSTAAGSASLTEVLAFAAGKIESLVPHKLHSLRYAVQARGSSATINQLDVSKSIVEFTGSTNTELRGIDSAGAAKVVVLHSRMTSGVVTLKHQSTSALTAADRMILPDGVDFSIQPQGSVTMFYSTADSRWKVLKRSAKFTGFSVDTLSPGGTFTPSSTTTQVRVTARKSTNKSNKIFAGALGFARDFRGPTYFWGDQGFKQGGVGDATSRSSPVAVLGGLLFDKVYAPPAPEFAMGLTVNGDAYAWGYNEDGQLGVGDTTDRSSPVLVLGGLTFRELYVAQSSGFGYFAFGITTANKLYGWGANNNGQLGVGDVTPRSSPVAVLGGLDFEKIVVNANTTANSVVGLTTSGELYAWGANNNGRLGVGDTTPRSSPVAVLGGLKFSDVKVVSTLGSFMALTTGGAAYGWGIATNFVLGNGDNTPRSSPIAVLGGLTFKKIFEGDSVAFGLTSAGVLYSWGSSSTGALGQGSTTGSSSPVLVLGGLTFDKVYNCSGGGSSYGITTTGVLYAWGRNQRGELGVGDTTGRSSPVAVLGGLTFYDLSSSSQSVGAITRTGLMYAWGFNNDGQLGVGDVTPRSSPVAVLGGLAFEPPVPVTAQYDFAVNPGTVYTFNSYIEKAFFGPYQLMDNTETLEVEYV